MNFLKNYFLNIIVLNSTLFGCKNKLDPNEQNIHKVEIERNLEETKNNTIIKNCRSNLDSICTLETYFKQNKISLTFSKKYEPDKITIKNIKFSSNEDNKKFYQEKIAILNRTNFNKEIPFDAFGSILNQLTIIYSNTNDSIIVDFIDTTNKQHVYGELTTYLEDSYNEIKDNDEIKEMLLNDSLYLQSLQINGDNFNYENLKKLQFFPKEEFELFEVTTLDLIRKNKEQLSPTNN